MYLYFKKNKLKTIFMLYLLYFLIVINYRYFIAVEFRYLGYSYNYFSIDKFILSFLLISILINISIFIKNNFYYILYNITLVMIFFGQSIYYMFNQSSFLLVLYLMIPLILLLLLDFLDNKYSKFYIRKKFNLENKKVMFILLFMIILAIIPYFKYINKINIRNLLLMDIYKARSLSINVNIISRYLYFSIARVLLPFLFIFFVNKKKYFYSFVMFLIILLLFLLNGAIKSVFLGVLSVVFFIKGSYFLKLKRFLISLISVSFISLLNFKFDLRIIFDYLRRLFLTPAKLFQTYYNYFSGNYTLFLHSRISKIVGVNVYEGSLPVLVGENIMGVEDLSANVGIFVEGFISFGFLGVLIASIIFVLIIYFLKLSKFKKIYFGLIFQYIYILNTSFVEPLFITHGLLMLLLIGYFFVPREEKFL